jgi:hypothetical protein
MRQRKVTTGIPSLLILAGGAALALAAEAPPLKPGLWQITTVRTVNGQAAPSGMDRLQNLPPEARERVAAAMQARGVALPDSGGGAIRICMTREALERGQWQQQPDNGHCDTSFSQRTGKAWKWHSVCTLPRLNGTVTADGEASFADTENYQVTLSSTMQAMGRTTQSANRMSAKWLATDCGAVKPLQPRAAAGVPRR